MAGRLVPDLFLYFKKLHLKSKEVVNTWILIYSGGLCLGHTIKTNCTAFQKVDPEICSILIFRQGSVSPPHFVYDFSRKMCIILYTINWSNFIVWLPLRLVILSNWDWKEVLRWNKKYFSSFWKCFPLSKIVSDLRVRL